MAREIKFRAWTGERMIQDVPSNTVDVKLMQFTGMKDMNDQDIYEGDLVRETHIVPEERFVTVCPIEFADGMFIINDENFGEQTPLHENVYGCEVVGNIYENPELMAIPDE